MADSRSFLSIKTVESGAGEAIDLFREVDVDPVRRSGVQGGEPIAHNVHDEAGLASHPRGGLITLGNDRSVRCQLGCSTHDKVPSWAPGRGHDELGCNELDLRGSTSARYCIGATHSIVISGYQPELQQQRPVVAVEDRKLLGVQRSR